MSSRLKRELGIGLALTALARGGAYWQADRTSAFEKSSTLRLVCPLH